METQELLDKKERLRLQKKKYRDANKEKAKQYYEENKTDILSKNQQYRELNKQKIQQINANYYKENADKFKQYALDNREQINQIKNSRHQTRKNDDDIYSYHLKLRSAIHNLLQKDVKTSKYESIIGCSIQQFKEYMQQQLPNNIQLKNYSQYGYEIDHKEALLNKEKGQITKQLLEQRSHYTNIRFVSKEENQKKGANNLVD